MKKIVERYKWIVELIGILSIIASLIFVGLQLQQTQLISLAEFDSQRVQINLEYRAQIIEHIDIWTKGNADKALDTKSQEIYEMLIDNTWNRASAQSQARARIDQNASGGLLAEFASFLHNNPGARETWLLRDEASQNIRSVTGVARLIGASGNSLKVKEFLVLLDAEDN